MLQNTDKYSAVCSKLKRKMQLHVIYLVKVIVLNNTLQLSELHDSGECKKIQNCIQNTMQNGFVCELERKAEK